MTEQCKHEWEINLRQRCTLTIECVHCPEVLSEEQAESRLNATERLSAEVARGLTTPAFLNEEKFQAGIDALKAYADTLERLRC